MNKIDKTTSSPNQEKKKKEGGGVGVEKTQISKIRNSNGKQKTEIHD